MEAGKRHKRAERWPSQRLAPIPEIATAVMPPTNSQINTNVARNQTMVVPSKSPCVILQDRMGSIICGVFVMGSRLRAQF